MNKFKYYFILLITTITLFSCTKDPEVSAPVPAREFAVQYATDIADIEEYLKTYYIEDINPDVVTKISKIPTGGNQSPIWSYLNNATFPKLLSRDVIRNGITYKLYYVVLREGTGVSPSSTDAVLTAYRGEYLSRTKVAEVNTLGATFFEEISSTPQFFELPTLQVRWGEVLPEFKTGTYASNSDGTISYSNFGAGILFFPSGLAYYDQGNTNIPAYAPLVFSIKLYEINRLDSDKDGIPNYLEDLDGDKYMTNYSNPVFYPTPPSDAIRYADDTDRDGIPNYQDTDDDGDGVSTKTEITAPNGVLIPFNDIPSCDGNTTDPARKKRHLVKCN